MQSLQFDVVVRIGVFPYRELFFVRVVARIHSNFFHMFDRLHGRRRKKVNIRNERNMPKSGCGDLSANLFQATRGSDIGRGDANDFAAHFCQRNRLLNGRSDVLRIAGRHGLNAHGIIPADPD